MGINPAHLRAHVVAPVLADMAAAHGAPGLESPAAHELVMGTVYAESRAQHLVQLGSGPALGIAQVEPATARWLDTRLRGKAMSGLATYFDALAHGARGKARHQSMTWNLRLAVAYCRLRYWVVRDGLPEADDARGLAAYWKRWYNTEAGAGTVQQWLAAYRAAKRGERAA